MPYKTREADEDTGAIQTFAVTPPEDPDVEIENPDTTINKEMPVDYSAAEVMAVETAWINAQNEFVKSQKEQKNYPRIDVMVDKNCLISYTGHMEDYDHEGFREILEMTIMARLDLENIINERAREAPHPVYEQSGYQ